MEIPATIRKLMQKHPELDLFINALLKRISDLEERLSKLEEKVSTSKPSFVKPNKPKTTKKPGRKPGFTGTTRQLPVHVGETINLDPNRCPNCNSELSETVEVRERCVEDIRPTRPYIKRYRIHRKYCTKCRKIVYRKPRDVIPKCRFGLHLMLFITYQHYALHLPVNKICQILATCFSLKVSEGSIVNAIGQIAKHLGAEFELIKQEMRKLKTVYIDETGWRIGGVNHWLWDFISDKIALLLIDKSRGSKIPSSVLGKDYSGTTVNDRYSAYNKLGCKKQKCWLHILRASKKLSSEEGQFLHSRLKAIYKKALRAAKLGNREERERAKARFEQNIEKLVMFAFTDKPCITLVKSLVKHKRSLFRFVIDPSVKPHNNDAERGLRSSIVMRKISGGNRSVKGARNHEVIMSVMETWKRQDKDFFTYGMEYLRNHLP